MMDRIEAALNGTPETSRDEIVVFLDRVHSNIEKAEKSRMRTTLSIFFLWFTALGIDSKFITNTSYGGVTIKNVDVVLPILALVLAFSYYLHASSSVSAFLLKDTHQKIYKYLLPSFNENKLTGLALPPSFYSVETHYFDIPYKDAPKRRSASAIFTLFFVLIGIFIPIIMYLHVLYMSYSALGIPLFLVIGSFVIGAILLIRGFLLWFSIIVKRHYTVIPLG